MKELFKKHGKSIYRAILVTAATAIAYMAAHKVGTIERGYEAIGGEIFMLLIPLFVWLAPMVKKSVVEMIKECFSNEVE